jgi:ribonuclease VapC
MIVDSSAIVAILREESDAEEFAEALKLAPARRMSAVTYVETGIVADCNRDPVLSLRFDELIQKAGIQVESVTPQQARIARQAYRDFGKGRHKARLNLGDCFAYALAKEMHEPLLFKGRDFHHTDIEAASA